MATKKTTPAKATKKAAPAKAAKTPKAATVASPASVANDASNAIDVQLARYREMRDFTITAEPAGSTTEASPKVRGKQYPFVIQKHAASHLHYDFRLGWNGVLKSWACAKGPSYVTADKRLAVQVEDHPMEYGGFEGIIPAGQYGGGTVMLWDQGTWEPQPGHTDVDEGLRTGSLKITMYGTKMKGNWALVRMGGKAATEKKPNWLLIKEHDDFEQPPNSKPITESEPNSVVTNRSLQQIAVSEDHVWNSKEAATGNAWHRQPDQSTSKKDPSTKRRGAPSSAASPPRAGSPNPFTPDLSQTPEESLPTFISPQLADTSTTPTKASGWIHELKFDGYRIQARKQGSKVQLLTRSGLDWTHRMKPLAKALEALPAKSALFDGEVVVLSADGNTSFANLQAAFENGDKHPFTYFIFDLLHLNGHNLRNLPLLERKALLAQLLTTAPDNLRISEHLDTDAAAIFKQACNLEAEGIISKRADSKYASGRSASWLKLKCIREQEFVIGGFTLPAKGHFGIHGVGALLLGYYDADQKLVYAGRTGTGFTQKTHRRMRDLLEGLRDPRSPFLNPPAEARRDAIWVKPILVAQIRFATWTSEHLVRQASFKGLREDKPANEVTLEQTAPDPTIPAQSAQSKPDPEAPSNPSPAKSPAAVAKRQPKPAISFPNSIRLTHPEKILDPDSRLTKHQLAEYYWAIAPYMLPHIADRPLSLVRCPEGATKPCFFQKHTNHMLPPGITAVDVPDKKTGKPEPYITLSTPEALTALAQMGVLEVHPWGSTNSDLEHPNRIIIDLDPDPTISWRTLADSAADVRAQLKSLRLESFLKTTGGKGLHIVFPIDPTHDWATVKQFVHTFALAMEQEQPALYLTKMSKAARKDRIFIDYLRNERGATAVAPYSPRARAGAPVSVPIPWSDLKLPDHPRFHITNFDQWKSRLKQDPWKSINTTTQKLPTA